MNPTPEEIGANLRKLRKEKGLTLAEMAKRCQCSSSLLSQIETGTVNPSFSTLKTVSDALGISMASLFTLAPSITEKSFALTRRYQRKTLITRGGVKFQLLSRGIDFPCEFILNEWPPGSSTGKDPFTHDGAECFLLLEGELDVEIDGTVQHLKPGDTMTLTSSVSHRVSNPGKKKAVAVWVNSVPFMFAVK